MMVDGVTWSWKYRKYKVVVVASHILYSAYVKDKDAAHKLYHTLHQKPVV